MRVHACLYFVRPTGHALKPLDVEIMKRLGTRVNLIPVIAKADTLTPHDLALFKRNVSLSREGVLFSEPPEREAHPWTETDSRAPHPRAAQIREVIQAQGIRIYTPPVETDDEQAAEHARILAVSALSRFNCCDGGEGSWCSLGVLTPHPLFLQKAAMPFSIIGSTSEIATADGRTVKGRQYLWGVAEVENEEHCDFKKLRSLLVRTHMLDLIQTTEEGHYEQYRQAQMETRKFG